MAAVSWSLPPQMPTVRVRPLKSPPAAAVEPAVEAAVEAAVLLDEDPPQAARAAAAAVAPQTARNERRLIFFIKIASFKNGFLHIAKTFSIVLLYTKTFS